MANQAFRSLDCAGHELLLDRPRIMGILNVTPDSFSDGGFFVSVDRALAQAEKMVVEGVDIIDVGGESTRPGADEVSLQQELDRVLPVIEALRANFDTPVSIDTSKAEVMTAAVASGAGMINDVCALQLPGALEAAEKAEVPICLMHMQGKPRTMQQAPHYEHVVKDVMGFLATRVEHCLAAGISKQCLLIDPGFGFGKSLEHNLCLLKQLTAFQALNLPILVGMSRKSMIGKILDAPVEGRLVGTIALTALSTWMGADIIRVHDVAENVDAVNIIHAVAASRC